MSGSGPASAGTATVDVGDTVDVGPGADVGAGAELSGSCGVRRRWDTASTAVGMSLGGDGEGDGSLQPARSSRTTLMMANRIAGPLAILEYTLRKKRITMWLITES